MVKRLANDLPLRSPSETDGAACRVDLTHLKRVRRTMQRTEESKFLPCKKRHPGDRLHLELLLGTTEYLDRMFLGSDTTAHLKEKYNLLSVYRCNVPGRFAESEKEWKEFQAVWPIVHFANKTPESIARQLSLSGDEVAQMAACMAASIVDAKQQTVDLTGRRIGVVIVDPKTGQVLARSGDERLQQGTTAHNPLATSIVLAIQGVSRLERQSAISHGMDSTAFRSGQYLCTGCDCYTTLEPTAFEAMALVHARIRRTVFGCALTDAPGGLTGIAVHTLPGTNHKYRAFACGPESELGKVCRELRDGGDF